MSLKDPASLPQHSTVDSALRNSTLSFYRATLELEPDVHSDRLPGMAGGPLGQTIVQAEYGPLRVFLYHVEGTLIDERARMLNHSLDSLDAFTRLYDEMEHLLDRPLGLKDYRSDRLFAKAAVSTSNAVFRLRDESGLAA